MSSPLLATFRQAYRDLDLFPLLSDEEVEAFRVDYGRDALVRLEQAVDDAPEDGKIIFAGHRGCGKSTLLAHFGHLMSDPEREPRYFVVRFSISDMVEMSAVDHVNILYAIALQLLSKASDSEVDIPTTTQEEILNWFITTHSTTETKDLKSQIGIGGDVLKVLTAKLQTESTFREEIKRTYERRISELVAKIEEIAGLIQQNSIRPLLVIIDDLDKLDWKLVEEIYKNNILALFQPKIRMVFTIPIAVVRDIELRTILQTACGRQIVQMGVAKFFTKADRHRQQQPDQRKVDIFLKVLERRFGEHWVDLMSPQTARQIVLLSGGVLREMVRIARECCSQCSLLLRLDPELTEMKIDDQVLDLAVRELRNEFSLSLGKRRSEILVKTYEDAKPEEVDDEDFALLLHGLYILEYRNNQVWYNVHPIVKKHLQLEQLLPMEESGSAEDAHH